MYNVLTCIHIFIIFTVPLTQLYLLTLLLLLYRVGVKTFILFPKIPTALKSNYGEECYNPSGLVPRAIKRIKTAHPEVVVCTDVALDPYSSEVSIVYGVCMGSQKMSLLYLL